MTDAGATLDRLDVERRTPPEVAPIAWEETERMVGELDADLLSPDGVVWQLIQYRFREDPSKIRSIAHGLESDLRGYAARYEMVAGTRGEPAPDTNADDVLSLWTMALGQDEQLPPVEVPEHLADGTMDLVRRIGMLGGLNRLIERDEVSRPSRGVDGFDRPARFYGRRVNSLMVEGAANMAFVERTIGALQVAQTAVTDDGTEIFVNATSGRILRDPERRTIAAFAPDAQNEFELAIASVTEGLRQNPNIEADYHPRARRQIQVFGGTMVSWYESDGLPDIGVMNPVTQNPRGIASSIDGTLELNRLTRELTDGRLESLEGSRHTMFTSMHYGPRLYPMMVEAAMKGDFELADLAVIGDNRPLATRGPKAHVLELAMLVKAVESMQAEVNRQWPGRTF